MSNRFVRPSLAVELNSDYFDFDDGYLWGPSAFNKPILRIYLHEVLHFWQTLSQGFVAGLALQECRELLSFEKTGDTSHVGQVVRIREEFRTRDPRLGFSAYELYEALCRYWDIHVLHPAKLLREYKELEGHRDNPLLKRVRAQHPRVPVEHQIDIDSALGRAIAERTEVYTSLAFDLIMAAEDAYARPYRLMLDRFGSKASVILFPLVGFFSLQSTQPLAVYATSIERLVQSLKLNASAERDIHKLWRDVFDQVKEVCQLCCSEECKSTLSSGWDVIRNSQLKDFPLYSHYLELFDSMGWNNENSDFCFALPGDPECRTRLASAFRPAVTLFKNGRWSGETGAAKVARVMAVLGGRQCRLLVGDELAQTSEDIHERFRKFREAVILG